MCRRFATDYDSDEIAGELHAALPNVMLLDVCSTLKDRGKPGELK